MMLKPWMVVFLFMIPDALAFDCCKNDFCNSQKNQPGEPEIEILIAKAELKDGICYCKENPGKYVKCFGHSCRSVPRNVNFTLPRLLIVTTLITSIKRADFAYYSLLTDLEIENNDNLETIDEFSFENLTNIVNMSISYNQNLKLIKPQTFAGLVNLRELSLLKNGFHSILDFSEAIIPKYLPVLQDLIIRDNDFPIVNATDFSQMTNSSLKRLDISRCRIELIDPDALLYFKDLEELYIGVNQISAENIASLLTKIFENQIPIKFLSLYDLGWRKKPPRHVMEVVGNSTVECLDLGGNQFEVISRNAFPEMKNVKLINFRDVNAVDIRESAFNTVKNLKILLLDHNKLTSIPPGAAVKSLTHLDIRSNSEYQTPTSYFTVQNFTFVGMNNLRILDLSQNTILALFNATFIGLENLDALSLKQCNILHIGHGTFSPFKRLTYLDLEGNQFAHSVFKPLETNLFDGLENLEVLYIGSNNITSLNNITFSSLKSLTYLDLGNNGLKHISYDYMQSMKKLNTLNLERNLITAWSSRVFCDNRNLSTVYLGNNRITNLSTAMLEDFSNLSRLVLSKNNFICDCQLYNVFHTWYPSFSTNKSVIDFIDYSSARCFPNDLLISEFLFDKHNQDLCGANYTLTIALVSSFIIILVSLSYMLYYYRWHLRYYMFLTRLHLIRKGRKSPSRTSACYTNYEYDAFVSYSNEDSNFVIRLVTMLENYEPYLKLCVYERDFRIGSIISEAILESVTKSRKILLIISESYVKSHWCQWETHIAQHCNLFFKDENGDFADDSLILIKLESVNEKSLTPTLKYLLKTRIYLQWEKEENKQKLFWSRLRNNLSLDKTKIKIELCNGDEKETK